MLRIDTFKLASSILLLLSSGSAISQGAAISRGPVCDQNGILDAGKPLFFPKRNDVAFGISLPKRSFLVGESIPAYIWIDNESDKEYLVSSCGMFSDWDVAVWKDAGQRLLSTLERNAKANDIRNCDSNVASSIAPHSCERIAERQLDDLFGLPPGEYRLGELPWSPLMEEPNRDSASMSAPLPGVEQSLLFNISDLPSSKNHSEARLPPKPKPAIDEAIAIPQVWGRVVRSDTGSPIPAVQVEVNNGSPNGACCHYAVTNSDGLYSFRGLADGLYDASAYADGFVTGDYHCSVGPKSVCKDREQQVTASSHLTMNFSLVPGAVIQGEIVTPDGRSAGAGLVVNAIPLVSLRTDSLGPYSVWGESITDREGRFKLTKLPPASYLIRVYQKNGGWAQSPGPYYHEVWYGNSASTANALPIEIKEGQDIADVNLTVHPEKRYNILLWLSGPDGVPAPSEYIVTVRDSNTTAFKQPDGSYIIHNVSPGHYRLDIFAAGLPPNLAWPHSLNVDVRDQDVTFRANITRK